MTDGQSGEQEPIATTSCLPAGAEDDDGVEDWSDLEDDGDNDGDLIQLFAIEWESLSWTAIGSSGCGHSRSLPIDCRSTDS